jgi:hypothetical protein
MRETYTRGVAAGIVVKESIVRVVEKDAVLAVENVGSIVVCCRSCKSNLPYIHIKQAEGTHIMKPFPPYHT